MKEPLLRYVACHRGAARRAVTTMVKEAGDDFRVISGGSLRGCVHRMHGPKGANLRSVYKLGRGFALEFSVVIRPGWPECLKP